MTFMQRTMRTKSVNEVAQQAVDGLKQALFSLEKAESVDSVRGYEGLGARLYFSVFQQAIKPAWAVFKGRSMNPPQDNVNAVLSFLYTLIFYRVDAALEGAGLDPYVGYLHKLNYGKQALAFDLVEEFRVPLADTLAVSLFNLGVLSAGNFDDVSFAEDGDYPRRPENCESDYDGPEKRGVLLTKEGLRKVITQFEKKLDTPFFYPPVDGRITYKKIFFEQIKHFRRVLTGEESSYNSFQIK